MDIHIEPYKVNPIFKVVAVIALVLLLGTGYQWIRMPPVVPVADVDIFEVKEGRVPLLVPTFGQFKFADEYLLTAKSKGVVSQIFRLPGQRVEQGDVIAKIENIELEQTATQQQALVAEHQERISVARSQQKQEWLNARSQLLEIKTQLAKAKLEFEIHTRLKEQGVSSENELLRAKLNKELLEDRADIEQQKFDHLSTLHQHLLNQLQQELTVKTLKLEQTQQAILGLSIRAKERGLVQSLNIDIGQSVSQGQAVAKVGSGDALVATIFIPSNKLDKVKLGHIVEIEAKNTTVKTQIKRIESVIEQSLVRAETHVISVQTEDTEEVLDIRATERFVANIHVGESESVLYLPKAVGLSEHRTHTVFVESNGMFNRSQITTGQATGTAIEITSPLYAGTKVITQLPSNMNSLTSLHQFSVE